MPNNYNEIVHDYFEENKQLFVNYLRKNFNMSYDDIMDIYINVWIDMRDNILNGRTENVRNWTSYILKLGWNQAYNATTRGAKIPSLDDETFDRDAFEREYLNEKEREKTIYEDPELNQVLKTELAFIPDPCRKIFRLYYHDRQSLKKIAEMMNYSSEHSAKTTKKRCVEKIKNRVVASASRLGIIDRLKRI